MLKKETIPLYLKSKDFEEGDLIFLPHKHQAVRIVKKINKNGCKMFQMEIYDHHSSQANVCKNATEKESWFSPIFFAVCRSMMVNSQQ